MNWVRQLTQRWEKTRRQRRRQRNFRAGATQQQRAHIVRDASAGFRAFAILAFVLLTSAGGTLIALHARQLVAAVEPLRDTAQQVDVLRAALPGVQFTVPQQPGIHVEPVMGGSLLVAAGMRAGANVHFNLCAQPEVRIGEQFDDVANLAGPALRGVALAVASAGMPKLLVKTDGELLQVDWSGPQPARWVSDASYGQVVDGNHARVAMRHEGWLLWDGQHALRLQRTAHVGCAKGGQLSVQTVTTDSMDRKALVTAFPMAGDVATSWLQAGTYALSSTPATALEDQALFRQLQARGLVRLGPSGLIDVVPRDLLTWRAGGDAVRAADLGSWTRAADADTDRALIKRLYRMADGDFVRQQIDTFNSERRLLAWRLRLPDGVAGAASAQSSATVAQVPVRVAANIPAAGARLFADLPQHWTNWSRIGQWPQGDKTSATIVLQLPQVAKGGERVELMLVGQLQHVQGATLQGAAQDACTGKACPQASAVQVLTLALQPGTRTVELVASALDLGPLSLRGDQQYRHLRVVDGKLDWHTVPGSNRLAAPANMRGSRDIILHDRNGEVLWSDGATTEQAELAGLAPMLGIRAEHGSSVAGMLARLPQAREATLSIDLSMQLASAQALACIGMRRGQFKDGMCKGGRPAPDGRRGGVVILDAENGDVLAAAGAGAGSVSSANWTEVRDFDQANPARSPLRLPALQHDGGGHNSPGSTFKLISALGLELAAQHDSRLDGLLGGMPLADINQLAKARGYAFQTNAPTYPFDARHVRITNYREQVLDRRAQDGRLGLAQALTYSLNTWFAWSGELSDRSLLGRADGGAPGLQALDPAALDALRPIAAMAHALGFEQALRLDGGLLPPDYPWAQWDALQASASHIDPIQTRHELRQMAIGLRMQATPLQMALAAGAIGQGRRIVPRLLLELDGKRSAVPATSSLGVRLDRIRTGMKGVVDAGTAAGAFHGMEAIRRGLYGKTGTSPSQQDLATVWFTGYIEAGTLPGQPHRLAVAAYVSHSEATGGEHAAPVVAAILSMLAGQKVEKRGI